MMLLWSFCRLLNIYMTTLFQLSLDCAQPNPFALLETGHAYMAFVLSSLHVVVCNFWYYNLGWIPIDARF